VKLSVLRHYLVGGFLFLGAHLPLPYALVFGALIAPTDPVAVTALFRSIGAPKRLLAEFEGESLLNNGTAIVLFKVMLVVAVTGKVNNPNAVLQFFVVAGVGSMSGRLPGRCSLG
jgi:monovalent cation:H+ antiporter, CPA1 family